jgi:hypothetical protein
MPLVGFLLQGAIGAVPPARWVVAESERRAGGVGCAIALVPNHLFDPHPNPLPVRERGLVRRPSRPAAVQA